MLLAALETLRHEALVKAGVLEQPVQPRGTGAEEEQLSKAQQAKQWFTSMLQFHKKQS